MDGKGRKFASAASTLGYGIGFLILTFAKTGGAPILYIGGIALGAGNGLSSGLVMTLGSDIAPAHKQQRSHFLAIYKTLADFGSFLGAVVSAPRRAA